MPETIGTAYVQIEPSAEGIGGKISNVLDPEAEKAGKSAGGKLSSALGGAAKLGVGAVAGLSAAVAGVGASITSSAASVAAYGDDIDKMSQKLGVSSSFYQEWDAVLQHSGTSMDSMSATFKKLATASQDASNDQQEAFKKLGLSMKDVQSMSTEQLFTSVISGLQGMEEGTERTALATQLLGRGAMEMGALLNTSAADTQAMIDTVNQLGGVMSDDAVKASAQFQDSLQDMQTAFTGVKNKAMTELLPGFSSVMDGLAGLVTGSQDGSQKIKDGMTSIISNVSEMIPKLIEGITPALDALIELAPQIVENLATGILNAIPALMPSLVKMITEITQGLIKMLPQLVEVGLKMIGELATGIAKALPDLIPTIADVVLQIVDTLIDNIDMLVDAAIAIMVGLAEGLIKALPKLIEKVPEIIVKLIDACVKNAPKMAEASLKIIIELAAGLIKAIPELIKAIPQIVVSLVNGFFELISEYQEIGSNIVSGIWEGIKSAWDGLIKKVSELGEKLVSKVKGFFDIGSPSKVFRDEVGKWIPEGMAVGITTNTDSVTSAVDNMMDATMSSAALDSSAIGINYSMPTASDDGSLYELMQEYLPYLKKIGDTSISLEGDAQGLFKMIRKENNAYRKSNGASAFA